MSNGLVPLEEVLRVLKQGEERDRKWRKENPYPSCERCQHMTVNVLTYYFKGYEIGSDGYCAYDKNGKRKRQKVIMRTENCCELKLDFNDSERRPTKCEGFKEGLGQCNFSKAKRIKSPYNR